MQYRLSYGYGERCVDLPDWAGTDVVMYDDTKARDEIECVIRALADPIESLPLRELAAGKQSAVILISDITRLCPSYKLLGLIIQELHAGGMRDDQVTVIISLGAHRKQTENELRQLVGRDVFERVRVVNHSAQPEDCIFVGTTKLGTPVELNREVVLADLRIAVGNIEPHGLAGMSGGAKALFPGIASLAAIEPNHALSAKHKADPGNADHPIRQDMEEALQFVPLHFMLNVIVNHRREICACTAGHPIVAHRVGSDFARKRFFVPVTEPYDLVIASAGGHPKDMQLYQAVKSLQNAVKLAKTNAPVLFVAECAEGYGNGILQYWVDTIGELPRIVQKLEKQFVLGAHKAAHLHQVLSSHPVHFYSSLPESAVLPLGLIPTGNLQQTANMLCTKSTSRIALMPCASLTFPLS